MVKLEPPNFITTCDFLTKMFLSRFFPPKKTAERRGEIIKFAQKHGEDMSQELVCLNQMLNASPHHIQTNEVFAHTLFEGL